MTPERFVPFATNAYQDWTRTFVRYPKEDLGGLTHCVLGLAGETGEVCDKAKRIARDDGGILTAERKAQLVDELGDVCWYVAALADALDVRLSDVLARNIEKLESRRERGVLIGSGDSR